MASLKTKKRAERFCEILKFFQSQDGNLEFCNMISIMSGLGPQ
jgi:hypothetical protein